MGVKRKASLFEEDDTLTLHHHTSTNASPSVPSSSPLSTSTFCSTNSTNTAPSYDTYYTRKINPIPYFANVRTRKRHRDNRPAEEAVHEHTLRKLYDAQRLHLDEAMSLSEVLGLEEPSENQIHQYNEHEGQGDGDVEMTDEDVELPQTVQRNQRTLDAFFSLKGAGSSLHAKPSPLGSTANASGFLERIDAR